MEKSFNNLQENLEEIQQKIAIAAEKSGRQGKDIRLLAVTKTVDPILVNAVIKMGVSLLGESRAQEMNRKIKEYHFEENSEIHFIGALQSNKVRQIIDHVTMIQSVDRLSLVKEIEKQARQRERIMDICIQVNIGKEDSKSGIYPSDVLDFYTKMRDYKHIKVRGIMAIPPICKKTEDLKGYFANLRQILVDIQDENRDNKDIDILSMGMSDDYEIAIEQGANIVRIGSRLFGERN